MSIITTGAITSLLRPGLDEIRTEYDRYKGEYNNVYTTFKSFKHEEIDIEMKPTGYAVEKSEGGQISMDSIGQRFKYPFVHKNFGLGFEITEEAVEDNLYKQEFYNGTKMLIDSYEHTKEIMAMAPFNNAFNANVTIGNGQPLVSTKHPIDGGYFSNQIGAAAGSDGSAVYMDFSEASVEQAVILAQKFKDQAGLPIAARIESLLIPFELEFAGVRLLESVFRPGTANNDVNAMYSMKAIPQGYHVSHFLASPGNWFALTNIKNTRKHFIRTKFNITMTTDPRTRTLSVLGNGRYSFGMFTPLGVLGAKTAL